MRGRFGLKLEPGLFRAALDLLYRILRISVPAGFDSLSIVVGQFWFLSIVNTLGKVAPAAPMASRWCGRRSAIFPARRSAPRR